MAVLPRGWLHWNGEQPRYPTAPIRPALPTPTPGMESTEEVRLSSDTTPRVLDSLPAGARLPARGPGAPDSDTNA